MGFDRVIMPGCSGGIALVRGDLVGLFHPDEYNIHVFAISRTKYMFENTVL